MSFKVQKYNLEIGAGWHKEGKYGQYTTYSLDPEKLKIALEHNQEKQLKIALKKNGFKKSERQPDMRVVCSNVYKHKNSDGSEVYSYEKYQDNGQDSQGNGPDFDDMPF